MFGDLYAYLSIEGKEYFDEKDKGNMVSMNGMVINMNGGRFNLTKDNATINVNQNNGM